MKLQHMYSIFMHVNIYIKYLNGQHVKVLLIACYKGTYVTSMTLILLVTFPDLKNTCMLCVQFISVMSNSNFAVCFSYQVQTYSQSCLVLQNSSNRILS